MRFCLLCLQGESLARCAYIIFNTNASNNAFLIIKGIESLYFMGVTNLPLTANRKGLRPAEKLERVRLLPKVGTGSKRSCELDWTPLILFDRDLTITLRCYGEARKLPNDNHSQNS